MSSGGCRSVHLIIVYNNYLLHNVSSGGCHSVHFIVSHKIINNSNTLHVVAQISVFCCSVEHYTCNCLSFLLVLYIQ